ncbi:unnamed protein product [Clavelina lepadiformis]|uniref:Cytochrome P450 n=1 Tax=Clavelina lepadiformis TaxID=159417 RepID=A0ABP0G200_CLALP
MLVQGAVLLTVIVIYSVYLWYKRPHNAPPGPRGFPILGNLPYLQENAHKVLAKWSKTYGPLMLVRMGREEWLVINDFDTLQKAYLQQRTKFSGQPTSSIIHELSGGSLGILFADYGGLWSSQRKFSINTLRKFELGKRAMETEILNETSYLNEFIRSQNEQPFDIYDVINKATSNAMCHGIFGKRFDYDNPTFCKLLDLMGTFHKREIGESFQMATFYPALRHVPPFSSNCDTAAKAVQSMRDLVDKIATEHEKTYVKDHPRDLIDCFLENMKTGKDYFTHAQLLQLVTELFVAGSDTTPGTIMWCMHTLLNYPEAQGKLRKEIFDVIGSSGIVSWSHKPQLPYTNAFMEEVMRYHTLIPLPIRKVNEDVNILGYFVPKNTMVFPNLWAIHHDSTYFTEPEKFKPERFIDEKGNFVKSDHVIPFSIGSRQCLGEQLARMEVFFLLVSMVQKFEFLPDPEAKELPSEEGVPHTITFGTPPFKLIAREI